MVQVRTAREFRMEREGRAIKQRLPRAGNLLGLQATHELAESHHDPQDASAFSGGVVVKVQSDRRQIDDCREIVHDEVLRHGELECQALEFIVEISFERSTGQEAIRKPSAEYVVLGRTQDP